MTGNATVNGVLTVTSNTGILSTGLFNSGTTPTVPSGTGTRLIWTPVRGAFRAGGVTGSQWDAANIGTYSVAMGLNTTASGQNAVAFGSGATASGSIAIAMGLSSTAAGGGAIALGVANSVSSGANESVAIGADNSITGVNGLALGKSNTASNTQATAIGTQNTASGIGATAIGIGNTASGVASVTIGNYANTDNFQGAIVLSDFSTTSNVLATADNQFTVRAAGGTRIFSSSITSGGTEVGVSLAANGGAWASVSDRNRKMNFRDLDGEDVLNRLRNVPVTEWSYIAQGASIRHIGPMAQDFFAAFRLGSDDVTITTSDIDGINMAGVQALIERTDRLREENAALRSEVTDLRTRLERLEALEKRLEALEKRVP